MQIMCWYTSLQRVKIFRDTWPVAMQSISQKHVKTKYMTLGQKFLYYSKMTISRRRNTERKKQQHIVVGKLSTSSGV